MSGRRLARLLVLLPRRLLALGVAEIAGFAPCARFGGEGAADVALASRFFHALCKIRERGSLVIRRARNTRESLYTWLLQAIV